MPKDLNSLSEYETPWGKWMVLDDANNFKVKKIVIKPGQRLSYQKHEKRSEFWYVVQGEAVVTLEDVEHKLSRGEFINVPTAAKHRMANASQEQDLIFIEVQTGTYFGEDDITRFSDDYGRN